MLLVLTLIPVDVTLVNAAPTASFNDAVTRTTGVWGFTDKQPADPYSARVSIANNTTVYYEDDLTLRIPFEISEIDGLDIQAANPATEYEIPCPSGLKWAKPGSTDLFTNNGYKYGTMYWNEDRAYIVFGGSMWNIADSMTNAFIDLPCVLDEDTIGDVPTYGVPLSADGKGSITTVKIGNNQGNVHSYEKSGVYSNGRILWTIKYHAGSLTADKQPVHLVDTMANEHQVYVEDSFKVNGNTASPTVTGVQPTGGSGNTTIKYTIPAADYQVGKVFIFTYEASLTDSSFNSVSLRRCTNSVVMQDNAGNILGTKQDANVDVRAIDKNWITKAGVVNEEARIITWTLIINTNDRRLENLQFHDEMPEGLELLNTGSYIITLDGANANTAASINIRKNFPTEDDPGELCTRLDVSNFPTLPGGGYKGTYKLVYYTKIDDKYFEDDTMEMNFVNRAWMTFEWPNGSGGYITPVIPPTFEQHAEIDTSIVRKRALSYSTETQEILWEVMVNPHKVDIAGGTITDNFLADTPHPQEFVGGSFELIGGTGITGGDAIANKATSMTLTVGDIGKNSYRYKYKTRLTNPEDFAFNTPTNAQPTVTNTVKFVGTVRDVSMTGHSIENSGVATIRIPSTVLNKTHTGALAYQYYDATYGDNVMNWRVNVNQNKMVMDDVTIVDELPPYVTYIVGSARYSNNTLNVEVNPENPAPGQRQTLKITVVGGLTNATAAITFATKIDVENYKSTTDGGVTWNGPGFYDTNLVPVENEVTLVRSGLRDETAIYKRNFNNDGVIKSSKRGTGANASYIEYAVELNANGLDLTGISLSDVIPENLKLDIDSLKMYKVGITNTGANPSFGSIASGTVVNNLVWSYDADTRKIVITMPEIAANHGNRYVLVYNCYIEKAGIELVNTASFDGDFEGGTAGTGTSKITPGGGGGGESGTGKTALTIEKIDSVIAGRKIGGVEFELWSNLGGTATKIDTVTTTTTGEGLGKAVIGSISQGREYWLVESIPPSATNYPTPNPQVVEGATKTPLATYKFTVPSGTSTKTVTVSNDPIVKNIEFTKVKEDGTTPLQGAKFKITEATDTFTKEATSDVDGKVKFTGIPVGAYKLEEIEAPQYYKLDTTKYDLEVKEDGSIVLKKGGTTITKIENIKFAGELKHVFVSNMPAVKPLPQAVLDLLPASQGVDEGVTVSPTAPSATIVTVADGEWQFAGWDKASAVVTSGVATFTGTWNFVSTKNNYKITYEFVKASDTPAGFELPNTIIGGPGTGLKPADITGLSTGDSRTPATEPAAAGPIAVTEGVWTFKGWDKASITIDDEDGQFTGTWEFAENPKYTVGFDFVKAISTPAGIDLPAAVLALKPDSVGNKYSTQKVTVPAPAEISVDDAANHGTWTWEGWTPNVTEVTIDDENINLVGTWKFTADQTYSVTYRFVSATAKPLPAGVADHKPADVTGKYTGNSVSAPTALIGEEIVVTDGIWTFTKWDPTSVTITNKNEEIVGTWTFTEGDTYTVGFEFVSGTSGRNLPAAITNAEPDNVGSKYAGEKVQVPSVSSTTVREDTAEVKGTWTFQGWNPDVTEVELVDKNVNVKGTWTFVEDAKYNVTYRFESATAKPLPTGVAAHKPLDITGKYAGYNVSAPAELVGEEIVVADGVWTFTGWSPASVEITNKHEEIVGTWTFTEGDTYTVGFEFVSGTAGRDLPAAITGAKPANVGDKYAGEKVLVPTVSPATVREETSEIKGTWTFQGWDPNVTEVELVDKNVNVKGTWTFVEDAKYNVAYRFESATAKPLPTGVEDHKPANVIGKYAGASVVAPTELIGEEIVVTEGIWTFTKWGPTSVTITNKHEEIVGTWTFTEGDTYTVGFEFVSGTLGRNLPVAITSAKPANVGGKYAGEEVLVPSVSPASVREETSEVKGTWTFAGWDPDVTKVKLVDKNVNVKGTWTFVEDDKFDVTYEFVSGTSGWTLPAGVTTNHIPSDVIGKYKNAVITAPDYTGRTEVVKEGVWTFKEWNQDAVTIDDDDEKIVGTWTFVEANTYTVGYHFESGTEGEAIPTEVWALKPDVVEGLYDTDKVDVDTTLAIGTTVDVKEDGLVSGTWTFEEWDRDEITVNGGNDSFVGTWTYEAKPRYTIDYKFVGAAGTSALPTNVTNLLPEDVGNLLDGKTVNAPALPATGQKVELREGTWIFRGWDEDSITITGANATFTGIWGYEANEQRNVTYKFISGTSGETLPADVLAKKPADITGKYDKDVVNVSTTPAINTTVNVKESDLVSGTWTFKGWNEESFTINGKDEEFVGTWTFTPAPRYSVGYNFVSGTEDQTLPAEVLAVKPTDVTNILEGGKVNVSETPISGQTVVVANGVWTFKGWDKETVTIKDANATFTGTWEYTESKKYVVGYNFVSGTKNKALPAKVIAKKPGNKIGLANGATVNVASKLKVGDTVKVTDGTWTFRGWDRKSITINEANATFVGTWTFKANKSNTGNTGFGGGIAGNKKSPTKATLNTKGTNTGDVTNFMLYGGLGIIAIFVSVLLIVKKRRRVNNRRKVIN